MGELRDRTYPASIAFTPEQRAAFDRLERSGYLPALREWSGYPGAHRTERGSTIDHELETLFGPVTDLNGSTIAFLLDFEALHWPLHHQDEINERLGGMSGGPVFRLIEDGLTRLVFVGIVDEHGETFELVFARNAAVIRADGTVGGRTARAPVRFSTRLASYILRGWNESGRCRDSGGVNGGEGGIRSRRNPRSSTI